MSFRMEVGIAPGDFVLDENPAAAAAPPQKGGGAHPQFSAYVRCGQTAGWIKMPLGMQVGLGLSDIVLDGDLAPPPQKGVEPPICGPCLAIVAKRLDGSR